MSLLQRKIDVTITLGTGDFGDGKGNAVTLSGYRVYAAIQKFGNPTADSAEIRVYGISDTLIKTLTRLGKPLEYPRNNTVSVSAGDDVSGMSVVYAGQIFNAYGDFDGAPDVCLLITAFVGLTDSSKPVAPISFAPGASASVIAAQIAAQMGQSFINSGVNVTIPGSFYAPGSSQNQLDKLAQAGNFHYTTSGGSSGSSVVIWPKGASQGAMGPLISPSTGLVGYPKYSDAGIEIRALYAPGMALSAPFILESSQVTKSTWYVLHLDYELEANNPDSNNPWFMHITGQRKQQAAG